MMEIGMRMILTNVSVLSAVLLTPYHVNQGLIPPDAQNVPQTKLAAKDNNHEVVVKGSRFLVELSQRARYQWKALPLDASAPEVAPKELEALRKFLTIPNVDQDLGTPQMQVSTFEMPEANNRQVKLVLIYTDRPKAADAPSDGKLYQPADANLSDERNRPKPNMRYIVTLKRE